MESFGMCWRDMYRHRKRFHFWIFSNCRVSNASWKSQASWQWSTRVPYTEKWNMPWDVPEPSGQLALRAALGRGCLPAGNGPGTLESLSCAWELFGQVLLDTEMCQEMFKGLGEKMIMYTPPHSISKREAFYLPQGWSIFFWWNAF